MENYYFVLGVASNATPEEIKRAYRNIVKKYHPDVSLFDKDYSESVIRRANEAYRVLSDANLRVNYDAGLQNERQMKEQVRKYQEEESHSEEKSYNDGNNYRKTAKKVVNGAAKAGVGICRVLGFLLLACVIGLLLLMTFCDVKQGMYTILILVVAVIVEAYMLGG